MRGVHGRKVTSWIGCGFGENGRKVCVFQFGLKTAGNALGFFNESD